ncbi:MULTISPECIES: DUF3325 domain-containing protein [Pandoraea]|uniref:DUF3325 domain-containing protein n=1 Tax=Pandoraea TaxID=93217 RepID=UPI001F5C16AD|nr:MULTISPECIES: DUF3325 domain-containing protein [Pandoraea]MCI3205944.1 DUF3325 domain-containing protein [Pandoraea sp. LA3]MDN4583972.1 DUF3325 domain-containing protein [Pandoraea capi]
MMHVVTFFICLVGFAALAMATERQQETFFGGVSVARTRASRGLGWTALIVALAATVVHQGWGLGLVNYSGQTSMAAGLVYLTLIMAERRRSR